ncbi:MAG: prepilin-type N-terminal cleavage/methylation domain-containing protein [bacterium]|nr:prepilin-type N-terminal cleavage/methylation domain-containing protein [bacterium]
MQIKNFFYLNRTDPGLNKLNKFCSGFTIVETMISISIFLVVVVVGTSTLLQTSVLHQKSQDMRSITDSLSFMMEEMSRDLRTGSNYRCITDFNDFSNPANLVIDDPRSWPSCGAMAFDYTFGDDLDHTDQWAYKVESTNGGATFNLSKSIDSGVSWVQLNPSEVNLNGAIFPFSVLGAPDPTAGDSQQPLVIIKLVGTITSRGVVTPFSLQTSVSQRLVDL